MASIEKKLLILSWKIGIGKRTFTNSRDALLHNYDLGHRIFEVDFSITSDNEVVCVHDWNHAAQIQGRGENPSVLSADEFESKLIYGKYTPVSIEELLLFMSEHEDVWIITDSKEIAEDLVRFEISYIVDKARMLGIEKVLRRVVVQIYKPEMYQMVHEIYKFPNAIFTMYQYWSGDAARFPDICRFCIDKSIKIITMPYYFATSEIVKIADEFGIMIYVHTVNDIDTVDGLRRIGVKGFYTDFLTPGMIEEFYTY